MLIFLVATFGGFTDTCGRKYEGTVVPARGVTAAEGTSVMMTWPLYVMLTECKSTNRRQSQPHTVSGKRTKKYQQRI